MKAEDLIKLTTTQAAAAIRDGTTTSEALVAAFLDRIEANDAELGAWAHVNAEHALEQARRADKLRGFGNGTGPLHGVPIGIKDVIETRDYPTENGSPLYAGNLTRKDAACVTALRSAGAIILGKTVTTELALLTPSKTVNPLDKQRSPGGSSAGSAAAVADLMVPGALGTQTAGSVLRPASYCGIYGFKPTRGLISRNGALMQSHTLDTLGVLARSIDDLALLTDCMSAHDPDDPVSYERSQPSLASIAKSPPPMPPTFAFIKTPAWDEYADPAMREAFDELTEFLGASCDEIELPGLDHVIEWQRIVQLAENAAYYGPLQDKGRSELSDGLNARLDEGARVPVRDYIEALASRDKAYEAFDELFETYTAILTPAAPGPAPLLSEGITGSPIFNGLWTYLGMPTISAPLLEIDGLPVGVQLVGLRQDDGRLLRTARWLANHLEDETQTAQS
ncbi:MAG: amidase [Alphaproteobacteria bacterium]|nr:amidase [Alphaproteobacteria bacterium]